MNLTASDSEYVAELVTLYGDAEVAAGGGLLRQEQARQFPAHQVHPNDPHQLAGRGNFGLTHGGV